MQCVQAERRTQTAYPQTFQTSTPTFNKAFLGAVGISWGGFMTLMIVLLFFYNAGVKENTIRTLLMSLVAFGNSYARGEGV